MLCHTEVLAVFLYYGTPWPPRRFKYSFDRLQALDGNWMETVAQLSGANTLSRGVAYERSMPGGDHTCLNTARLYIINFVAYVEVPAVCGFVPQQLPECQQQLWANYICPAPSRHSWNVQLNSVLETIKLVPQVLQLCPSKCTSCMQTPCPDIIHRSPSAGTKNVKLVGTDPNGNKYYEDTTRP